MSIKVGDPAPVFDTVGHDGAPLHMQQLLQNGPLVLYFYPKDETPGCTAQACAFRDAYEDFREAGAAVVGVSSDPVASHASFAARHRLPFPLIADEDGALRKAYGVRRTLGVFPGRVTFVIDGAGIVRHTFTAQFDATRHIREALDMVRSLTPRSGGPPSA